MKIYIIFIIVILAFIFLNRCVSLYEGMCDKNKRKLVKEVKSYPDPEYAIDPLYNSEFSMDCCPNLYSTSKGCLCKKNYDYALLATRGGNSYQYKYGNHPTEVPHSSIDTYS